MKTVLTFTSVLMLALCSGCGDSHESLTVDSMATMKEMVSVFEGVKDAESAKAAKSKLKSLFDQMNSIKERQKKLGLPTEADGKAILDKYGKEMEDLAMKMQGQMMRIGSDPAIRAVLDDIAMKNPPG